MGGGLSLDYPSHRLEDGRWPRHTDVYRAPVAAKARATPGDAPWLTRVTPDQEGPQDDPGGHHMVALTPPRTFLGRPRGAKTGQTASEHLGMRRPNS